MGPQDNVLSRKRNELDQEKRKQIAYLSYEHKIHKQRKLIFLLREVPLRVEYQWMNSCWIIKKYKVKEEDEQEEGDRWVI